MNLVWKNFIVLLFNTFVLFSSDSKPVHLKRNKDGTNLTMKLKLRLRNVKCIFVLKKELKKHLELFKQHTKNKILRLEKKICLTLYENNLLKIHITGISCYSDFDCALSFFKSKNIEISRIQVNNTFWLIKPLIINHFDKFAEFCKKRSKTESTIIDASNFGLSGDGGFLNSIYLRSSLCKGTVIIHRTSTIILGATNIAAIRILKHSFGNLLTSYHTSLISN